MDRAPSLDAAASVSDSGYLLDPDKIGQAVSVAALPRVRYALVTAAHRPSPLDTQQVPKELIQFGGTPLIVYCLEHLTAAGISEIVLVVAKNGELLARAVLKWAKSCTGCKRVHVEIVMMPTCYCHASSIVAARRLLPDLFLLVTGDHVFDPELVHRMANVDLHPSDQGCVLAEGDVDKMSPGLADSGVFVEHEADRVLNIGRSHVVAPERRSAVEAGLFLLRKRVVETIIDLSTTQPYYTLADALKLAANGGHLCCERVCGKAWLSFETLAQLQAASAFRCASDEQLPTCSPARDITGTVVPVGEIVDGVIEISERTPLPDELQRVISFKSVEVEASGWGSTERSGNDKRRRL